MRSSCGLRRTVVLAFTLAGVAPTFGAQEPLDPAPHAPRIALVLSGGGVRGLAHVGVLKALEELHVPIDLVVGSEWGALVGGLYASGSTPSALQSAIVSADWIDALEDRTPRRYLSFRSKQEDRDSFLDLPLGIGAGGVILPPGILGGSRLRLELARMTMGTLGTERFDDLPTPFRAVATDLGGGDSVTLESGSLARAIEASMSMPVMRPPVAWNGRRLVSGVIANQLPIDVPLALGAEVLIVVDVIDHGSEPAELDFIGVGERAMQLAARKNASVALEHMRPGDVLCAPDFKGVDLTDFDYASTVVERGYQAVLALRERLAPLALAPQAFEEHAERRRERVRRPPVLDSVRVAKDCPLGQESIRARIDSREGERLDPAVAGLDLARLYGLKLFQRVDFDLVPTSEDHADLVVDTEPMPTAPLHWRVGLVGEVNAGASVNFVAGGSVRYAPADDWGSEWVAQAEVGDRLAFAVNRRQALDPEGRWFLVPRASWEKRPVQISQGNNTIAQYSVEEFDLGADIVRELGDVWEASAGVVYRAGQSKLDIGDPSLGGAKSFEGGGTVLGLTCDSLDDTAFPTSGSLMHAEWFLPLDSFKAGQDQTASLRVDHAIALGRGALTLGGEFDTVIGKQGSVQSFFPLGGFLRLSGLHSKELSGPTAVLARAVYLLPFSPRALERKFFTWYGGISFEAGNVFSDVDQVQWRGLLPSGALFLAVDTLIGPMYLGYGLTSGGNQSAFLAFGRQF